MPAAITLLISPTLFVCLPLLPPTIYAVLLPRPIHEDKGEKKGNDHQQEKEQTLTTPSFSSCGLRLEPIVFDLSTFDPFFLLCRWMSIRCLPFPSLAVLFFLALLSLLSPRGSSCWSWFGCTEEGWMKGDRITILFCYGRTDDPFSSLFVLLDKERLRADGQEGGKTNKVKSQT